MLWRRSCGRSEQPLTSQSIARIELLHEVVELSTACQELFESVCREHQLFAEGEEPVPDVVPRENLLDLRCVLGASRSDDVTQRPRVVIGEELGELLHKLSQPSFVGFDELLFAFAPSDFVQPMSEAGLCEPYKNEETQSNNPIQYPWL